MSLISKFKSLLPVSSRSFHAVEKHFVTQNNLVKDELFDIKSKQDELFRRIEQTDNGINMNLNYKVGEVLSPTLKSISDDLDAHDSHMKMFAWDAYKNEGESIDDAKKRFFRSLPQATGGMRLLQLGCAKLLSEFDALCQENSIPYWLNFGTLLGAVRHGGFIPWDDDIDVSMPRPDFDSLVALARSGGLPINRSLEPYSGNWGHPVFLKYINRNIAVDAHYENGEGFLWMDVTPVEGLPADEKELARIYKRAGRLQRILMFCKADSKEGKTRLKRAFKRLFVPVANAVGAFDRSLSKLDDLGRGCVFGSTPWVGCTVWGLYGTGERYSYSGWEETVQLEFEGQKLNAISCWDAYLSGLYGDYMQLPPEDKRITHEIKAWRTNDNEK